MSAVEVAGGIEHGLARRELVSQQLSLLDAYRGVEEPYTLVVPTGLALGVS